MGTRRWKDALLGAAEAAGAIDLLQGLGRGPAGRSLYVLAYHRVETPVANGWLDPADASATPRQFAAQLELLARRYHPVTLDDVLAARRCQRPLPRDAVLLTVDDGYRNFADEIFPACARFGIRPVLFLATGCVGGGFYWWDQVYQIIYHSGQPWLDTPAGRFSLVTPSDRDNARRELLFALKRLPADQRLAWVQAAHATLVPPPPVDNPSLTWDELRELQRAGADVAPHTHSHPILSCLPLAAVRDELRTSRALIERELGGCPPAFALPDGQPFSYNRDVIDLLHAEGVELIFSMVEGRADLPPGGEPALLPRLGVWRALSLPGFHYRLTPPGGARRA